MNCSIVSPLRFRVVASLAACFCHVIAALPALHAQTSTGTITGRVLNESTGQYLRSATVTAVRFSSCVTKL